jgi:arsenite/tail-anchored protein-transporting ATPase
VRMVAMADILTKWVEKITEAREKVAEYEAVAATLRGGGKGASEDAVLHELMDIKRQVTTFTDLITDRRRTAFFMVLIPEQMAIVDTERALRMFSDLNIEMSGLIVNQVYPADLLSDPSLPEFLRNRIKMQQANLAEIRSKFGTRVVGAMPMFPREPKGLEMIERAAGVLMEPPEAVQRILQPAAGVSR